MKLNEFRVRLGYRVRCTHLFVGGLVGGGGGGGGGGGAPDFIADSS